METVAISMAIWKAWWRVAKNKYALQRFSVKILFKWMVTMPMAMAMLMAERRKSGISDGNDSCLAAGGDKVEMVGNYKDTL